MTAWILVLVLAVSRPARAPVEPAALAADVAATVEAAPPLPGLTREQTAALMVAVAWKESGLARDVDELKVLGDAGRACGLWQLQAARCADLTRREQAALALERMRRSFSACAALPVDERLSAYASGSCGAGHKASRARVRLARRLYAEHRP